MLILGLGIILKHTSIHGISIKSTGYSIFDINSMNFVYVYIYTHIFSFPKNNQRILPKIIWGIPYKGAFKIEPTQKRNNPHHSPLDGPPGSSTFTQLHVTRQSTAFALPAAPPGGWQGLRRPAAAASGASGKTAVKAWEIRKVGSFDCKV